MLFLWVFFPIVFIVNYIIKKRFSNICLLIFSIVFYAWGEPVYVILLIVSIIINWVIGIAMDLENKYRKTILFIGILLNLLILGYYKYTGLIILTLNYVLGDSIIYVPEVALPIGISFFTFQAISYIIDVYRGGGCQPQKKLVNLALYISFFPQLIAGPIVKYKEVDKQIENRNCNSEKIYEGIRRFTYGLGKKVLISNILAISVDKIYALDISQLTGGMVWGASLLYTFQIYYDFSGYSDMAIGLGKMFGFTFRENFNYPYLSLSIREFWRRWHISLSTWFKEYVYIPLGGNRVNIFRTYINLVIVFFLTGIWHGANYNFVLWGLYHGFFSIIERMGFGKKLINYKWTGFLYSFLVVNFGWVLFRIEDIKLALLIMKRMLLPWRYTVSENSIWEFINYHTIFVMGCAVAGMGFLQLFTANSIAVKWKYSVCESVYCGLILVFSIMSIASNTYNPFIYFKF